MSKIKANAIENVAGTSGYEVDTSWSFRNKLINGDFRPELWQRGTSFTANGYSADRWLISTGNATFTFNQYNEADGTYAHINITSSPSGSGYLNIEQRIEDVRTFAGKTVTLSFKTGTSTLSLGKMGIRIEQNFGSGGSVTVNIYNDAITVNSNGTFTLTVTLPSVIGKTIGADSFLLMRLMPSNYLVSSINGQTGSIYITDIQLEEGSVATPFEHRDIGLELSLCQRYYEKGYSFWQGTGLNGNLTNYVRFHVQKRITPTVTASYAESGGVVGTTLAVASPLVSSVKIRMTGDSATAHNAYFGGSWTADAEL